MYSVRIDSVKNRMYLVLSDFFTAAEAEAVSAEIKEHLSQLQPDFDFISDVRTFKPGSPEVATIMGETQAHVLKSGLNRFIRVVSEDVIGQMQVERVSRGSGLTVQNVTSIAAAEALLDA